MRTQHKNKRKSNKKIQPSTNKDTNQLKVKMEKNDNNNGNPFYHPKHHQPHNNNNKKKHENTKNTSINMINNNRHLSKIINPSIKKKQKKNWKRNIKTKSADPRRSHSPIEYAKPMREKTDSDVLPPCHKRKRQRIRTPLATDNP